MSGLSFVWILRYFSGDICFLLICPFRYFYVTFFPRNQKYDLKFWWLASELSYPRLSQQVYSIASGLLFSFPEKFDQGPLRSCWRDVCGPYFWHLQWLWICRYDLPYSQYWVRVKMVDMALKFLGNIEDTLQLDSNLEPLQLQSLKRQIFRLLRARTWHSVYCRAQIHSERHTWHDKDIKSKIGVSFVC